MSQSFQSCTRASPTSTVENGKQRKYFLLSVNSIQTTQKRKTLPRKSRLSSSIRACSNGRFQRLAVIFAMKIPNPIDVRIPTPTVDSIAPIAIGCAHCLMISLGPTICSGTAVVLVVVDVVVDVATTDAWVISNPSSFLGLTCCAGCCHRCRRGSNRRACARTYRITLTFISILTPSSGPSLTCVESG